MAFGRLLMVGEYEVPTVYLFVSGFNSSIYGTADGGDDPTAWENQKTLSKGFAAGESTLTAKVALPAGTTFVRFMTSGGSWSSTVYLPETQFEPGGAGFAIILR